MSKLNHHTWRTKADVIRVILRHIDDDFALRHIAFRYGLGEERDTRFYDDALGKRLLALCKFPAQERRPALRRICLDFDLAVPDELEERREQMALPLHGLSSEPG